MEVEQLTKRTHTLRNGEEVAVKVYSPAGHMRPQDIQLREFEVLRLLKHENIVQLLAVEEEQGTKHKVLIMELCSHGSLHTMLEDSQNAYGLEESEFLLVVAHVAAGMKCLRDANVVHRDIKPGNILRCIGESGRSIYKLTDFGAARELEDEDMFMSLYGTEEYLHPDMYERAVMRIPASKQFGATVDLWSLGVTFYHVATGQLPFRPFGGRRNRSTMYKITMEKESGYISGIQHRDGASIEWSRELPQTCPLSQGLQRLITPLLSGLLESDMQKTWNYDKFFKEVNAIISKLVVHVFSISSWALLKIYIANTDKLANLQDLIAEQTDIAREYQLIVYEGRKITDIVDEMTSVEAYPRCIGGVQSPIYLYSLKYTEFSKFQNPVIPNYPTFTTTISLENDYPIAKMCCALSYHILREIDSAIQKQDLAHQAVRNYKNEVYHRIEHLYDYVVHLKRFSEETINWMKFLDKIVDRKTNDLQNTWAHCLAVEAKVKSKLATVHTNLMALVDTELDGHKLQKSWDTDVRCSYEDSCSAKAGVIVSDMVKIKNKFKEDRAQVKLLHNDTEVHKLQKHQLNEKCVRAKSLIVDHCNKNSRIIYQNASSWLHEASDLRQKMENIERNLQTWSDLQETYSEKIKQICDAASFPAPTPPSSFPRQGHVIEFRKRIEDVHETVKRNTNVLISQFANINMGVT